jgi:hypothetical protein
MTATPCHLPDGGVDLGITFRQHIERLPSAGSRHGVEQRAEVADALATLNPSATCPANRR